MAPVRACRDVPEPAAGAVNVRAAGPDDVEAVAEILDEGKVWPRPFPRDELAERIDRDELFVVDVDGEPAATFTLLWDDPSFWGERPPDAAYLHKLAVRSPFRGRGLGAHIVEWADRRAAEAGRAYLRLDCLRDDPGIRGYYERLGFEHRGDVDHPRFMAALYERPIRR
jgi:GNAT superfamily N-acetyltransferase